VVQNSRFLIAPSVEVPNLASHVLAKAVGRLTRDWTERYGYAPALVETFVDEQRFTGSCYRAANWQDVGQTAGRHDGFANGKVSSGPKQVYVYPLCSKWREELQEQPKKRAVQVRPWAQEAADWAEEEFGGAQVYDGRLRRRLYELARDCFARPGALVPEMCGGASAKMKAAYRFFSNKRVELKGLLHGHIEATVGRMRQHEVVLAVQDTSTLNYSTHPRTKGLGPTNTKADKARGLLLHDTMAFSLEGTPLGLLDVQCWARDPKKAGKARERKNLPIEEKESIKWLRSYEAVAEVQRLCPKTMLVSVGDRESDIYELFEQARRTEGGPKLLVRAERSRQRKVKMADEESHEYLWDEMARRRVLGHQSVRVPRRGSRSARDACLEVRYAKVELKPPVETKHRRGLKPMEMWAVYALEVGHSSEVKSPLQWMLLTSVSTQTFEEALERLRWYTLRWNIEVYHRTLKSGCRIKDRQLGDANTLQSCLAIDMVVAWRIFWLVKQGRETPDIPCDVILEEYEWKALYVGSYRKPPPDKPMGLREAVRLIAALGGFLGRKGDGEPGTTTLWRGLGHLADMARMYVAVVALYRERCRCSQLESKPP
jgi:hypothetical protein